MFASPFFYQALVVLALIFSLITNAATSSTRQPPLKRLEHPSTLVLEILPRNSRNILPYHSRSYSPDDPVLRHSDSIRLTISSFSQHFHLHLHPNDDLIHPSARINYFRLSPDGTTILDRTIPLVRENVMAFMGDVVHSDESTQRLREDAAGGIQRPSGSLGWARIMIHHQGDVKTGLAPVFEGSFSVDGVVHHILTVENYLRNKHPLDHDITNIDYRDKNLVIFRDIDTMTPEEERLGVAHHSTPDAAASLPQSCAHDSLAFNRDTLNHPVFRAGAGLTHVDSRSPWYRPSWFGDSSIDVNSSDGDITLLKRDVVSSGTGNVSSNFIGDIGKTEGCSKTQKILYMGVAADCTYTAHYGGVTNATTQILNNWNTASSLYKSTFNVTLGIVELNIQEATCPTTPDPNTAWNVACSSDVTLNDRLSLFSAWRGTKGDADGAGLWHLMSGCPTGTEVGVAWLGQLCNAQASGAVGNIVSGTGVTTATRTEWSVVAHEVGHNFGALHDCSTNCTLADSCCPRSTTTCDALASFLMNPVSEPTQSTFSACTIGNICTSMKSMNTTCLADTSNPRTTISLQMCGNGIIEKGEDCDPGAGRNSTCCDSTTCKFTSGSVCDPMSSDCCTNQCLFAPSTQVCRAALDPQCDTQEMCSGTSGTCPVDHLLPNGTPCGAGGLKCANGACTSVDQQCTTIGASLNLTKACHSKNDKSCSLSCQDPTNDDRCIVLQAMLIDGSSCGYGGTCRTGTCTPGSFLDMAESWYLNNLQISIPVSVVAGLAGVFIMIGVFVGLKCLCCNRRTRAKKIKPELRKNMKRLPSGILDPNDVASAAYIPARRNGPPPAARGERGSGVPKALRPGFPAPHGMT